MSGPTAVACVLVLLAVPGREGGERAHTPLDAVIELPKATGRIEHFGDWNHDGAPDLVVELIGRSMNTILVHCASDGTELATLWKGPRSLAFGGNPEWDLGDIDGDGAPDLIVGLPSDSTAGTHAGAVQIVSGATTQTIAVVHGLRPFERCGSSVAYLGDLDGDGRGDFATGSPDPGAEERPRVARLPSFLDLAKLHREPVLQRLYDVRGGPPGLVRVHSGADQRVLWTRPGLRAGHGFGAAMSQMGDMDGDCVGDLVVRCESDSLEPAAILSGRTGSPLSRVEHRRAPCGNAGDLDGDGICDLFLDSGRPGGRGNEAVVVSGRSLQTIGTVEYADIFGTELGVTVPVGDLDGDGFDDVAVGEPDYNLPTPEESPGGIDLDRLRGLTLTEARKLTSSPRSMMESESGCLLVISGRTRRPMWGVWGRPGTLDGMGRSACAIPDVSGDGHPDLVVGGSEACYVFAGPGR